MPVAITNNAVRSFGAWILSDTASANGVDTERVISERCSSGDRCSSFASSSDPHTPALIPTATPTDSDSQWRRIRSR